MRSLWYSLIRISAFLRKEIVEILRQPRLVLTLILGPFLILLLFGLGYYVQAQPVRAIFVIEPGSPVRQVMDDIPWYQPCGSGPHLTLPEAQAELLSWRS